MKIRTSQLTKQKIILINLHNIMNFAQHDFVMPRPSVYFRVLEKNCCKYH